MYPFLLLINRCNLFQGPYDAQFFWGEAAVPDGFTSVAEVQEATVSQGTAAVAGGPVCEETPRQPSLLWFVLFKNIFT